MWRVISILVLVASAAVSQPRRGGPPAVPPHLLIERLSRMTPSERDRLLSRLPAERRSLLEERISRYSNMPEDARKRLREEYEFFQQLPEDKQAQVRKLYRQFSDLPDERRRELRRELLLLRSMDSDGRSKRVESEAFRMSYEESERHILTGLIEILQRHSEPSSARP